jgi:hypothetical protein
LIVDPYVDLGVGEADVIALDPTLTPRWMVTGSVETTEAPTCTASTCVVTSDGPDGTRTRLVFSGVVPITVAAGRYETPTPIVGLDDGRYAHVARRVLASPTSPDVAFTGMTDGRVAVSGVTDVVYTSNGPQLHALRSTGSTAWIWTTGFAGTVVKDAAAGHATSPTTGIESKVYALFDRISGGYTRSRLVEIDEGVGSNDYDLPLSIIANAVATAPNGRVYVAGYFPSGGPGNDRAYVSVHEGDTTFLYDFSFGGTAISRATDIVALPNGDAIVVGVAHSGTVTVAGRSVGTSLDGLLFAVRLRMY